MLDIGIIGLGPQWESRFRPALGRLTDRLRVCAIYDPIPGRAEQSAAEFHAAVCLGMLELVEFSRVKAVLILDDAWRRDTALSFAVARDKPAFIADFSAFSLDERCTGNLSLTSKTTMLVTGLSLRYTPGTCRLRELMATRLGAVLQIQLNVPGELNGNLQQQWLIELCDWCRYLTETPADEIRAHGQRDVQIQFKQTKRGTAAAVARLLFSPTAQNESEIQDPSGQLAGEAKIICERGTAILSGTNQITWTHAGATQTERLEGERAATDLLLDLYCRRVNGGLVPVPTPEDVIIAAQIAAVVESSRQSGHA